jgi:hypothetical protein
MLHLKRSACMAPAPKNYRPRDSGWGGLGTISNWNKSESLSFSTNIVLIFIREQQQVA